MIAVAPGDQKHPRALTNRAPPCPPHFRWEWPIAFPASCSREPKGHQPGQWWKEANCLPWS